jgi:hypothetical protein
MSAIVTTANQLPAASRIYLNVRQFAETQPGLTEAALLWDLFNRATNGLAESGAIIRRGRRILIDPERYLDWLAARTA